MRIKTLLSFVTVIFAVSLSYADNGQYYFKFDAVSHKQVNQLSTMISIAKVDGQTIYAFANENEFTAFQKLGIPHEILPDPGSLTVPAMAPNLDRLITDWDAYPTYQQYLDMMNAFAANYPDLCTIVNIGSSVRGRQLLFAKISDNVNIEEDEPEAQYSASMHGNETAGYVLMLRLIDYLLTNYGTDLQVTNIVNNMEIWINPLANPDGAYYRGDSTVNGAIRYNANHVDLNRNFPDPDYGQHPGGHEWEPETVAMMDFCAAHSFTISANFHGGEEVVVYPWGTWIRRHPDYPWYISIARAYADTAHAYANSGYMTYGDNGIINSYDWYRVVGGRLDYMTYFMGGRETVFEISGGFIAPGDYLPRCWNYNIESFLHYLENALYGIRGIVTDESSGSPLPAVINVLNHDTDSSRVFTDPRVGDYHRMIAPGTYSLQFVSPGYIPQTISDVTVTELAATTVNVQLQPVTSGQDLAFSSHDAGVIGIGDTVSMHITLSNNGRSDAINPVGILSTSDPYATIIQNNSTYPTILSLASGTSIGQYGIIISPTCPVYHSIEFHLALTADGYSDTSDFSIMIGMMVEDFESGNFDDFFWQTSGDANWYVTSVSPYRGQYCARSGNVSNNWDSQLSVRLNIAEAGEIKFHYSVSSENWADFLIFYIDDLPQDAWSGDVAWREAAFPVTAGVHTFKWIFIRDYSGSFGGNCGFIDDIRFPRLGSVLEIVTPSLPDWTLNNPYSQQLQASGAIGGLIWDDHYGDLSGTGLTLSSGGLLSGIPVNSDTIVFTARVQDENADTTESVFTFTINPQLAITTEPLLIMPAGMPCRRQLNCSGGTGIKNWIDLNRNLIGTGLTLSSSGYLSGTPPRLEEIDFTAQVFDIAGDTTSSPIHISVVDPGLYLPGDANNDGITNGIDFIYLSNYFKGGIVPPLMIDCPPHGLMYAACDVNGNCIVNGIDVTYLVKYFKGGPELRFCNDCPPARIQLKNSQGEVEDSK